MPDIRIRINKAGWRFLPALLLVLVAVWPALRPSGSSAFVSHSNHSIQFRNGPLQDDCIVECDAMSPESALSGTDVEFTGMAMLGGCVGAPVYEWDFGDGLGAAVQNPTHAYSRAGVYNWRMTVSAAAPSSTALISTVGGGDGDGDPALSVSFARLMVAARDPQGRGIYLASIQHSNEGSGTNYIRFLNTGAEAVEIAGKTVMPGAIRTLAGGGLAAGENIPALSADVNGVTGMAAGAQGAVLYYTEQSGQRVRALNVSSEPVAVAGEMLDPGHIRTFADPRTPEDLPLFGGLLYGLAYNPANGELAVCDASPGSNKVYRINQAGVVTLAAGNGEETRPDDTFVAGLATQLPLLDPRAVKYDTGGNLIISDTGHARVVRVAPNGGLSLVRQFNNGRGPDFAFPAGLALVGADIYSANGNEHRVARASGGEVTVAGQFGMLCEYASGNDCGDGGLATASGLLFATTTTDVPLIGLEGDSRGLYILDQTPNQFGRVRYVNLSQMPVTLAGVQINPGIIRTIAGSGLNWPYDGGSATGATFRRPLGAAADAARNLYVTDATNGRLRFINRSGATVQLFSGTPAAVAAPPGAIVTINRQGGAGPGEIVPVHFASLQYPAGLTITSKGLYLVDARGGPFVPPGFTGRITSLVRFINTTNETAVFYPNSVSPISVPPGFIATIAGGAGDNIPGNGDGLNALSAKFFGATDLAVAPNGDIYLPEGGLGSVRRVNAVTGIVSSLSLPPSTYTGLGFGPDGRLYIADAGNDQLLRENAPDTRNFSPLGEDLGSPRDVAVDIDGIAYVVSAATSRILGVAPDGAVSVIAGTAPGFAGDGGPAMASQLNLGLGPINIGTATSPLQVTQAINITATPTREIFFADVLNQRVRRLGTPVISCVKTGTITINNPQPALSALSPESGFVGGGDFQLTLTGTNFVSESIVRWNGSDRPTSFISSTQIMALIPASDLNAPGMINVRVFNPGPGGGLSEPRSFAISNPVPALASLAPPAVVAGGAAFVLTVNGSAFANDAVVRWNGDGRPTVFVSRTQLTVQIPASDIALSGSAEITVFNPAPGGGASGALSLAIDNPVAVIASLAPDSISAAGPDFVLTVNGTNFVPGSVVRWNGANRMTTFVDATRITAEIPATDIAASGSAQVTVFNPMPGGGLSAPASFGITNPIPTITALTPMNAAAGGNAFTLTVTGINFVSGAEVFWNDAKRPTTFIDNQTLTAVIPATDIARGGTANVKASNPAPGGGISNVFAFTINNQIPTLVRLEPDRLVAGSADILLTIIGAGFAEGAEVRVNGQVRVTTFVDTTQVRAVLTGADLANVGMVQVAVFNPAPGGGVSSPLNLTVFPPNPSPTLMAINPSLVVQGTGPLEITVTGTNFIEGSEVHWNGVKRDTVRDSDTRLRAVLTAADVMQAGAGTLSVFNPPPGGGGSNGITLTIAGRLAVVSAASFAPGAVAAESIVAGFGARLAVGIQASSGLPLPFLLLGTSVQVRDSNGDSRQAPLFFVAPGQINFQIPPGTALGAAVVTVTSADGSVSQGTVQIASAAAGIFAANSDGSGVAAGNFLRVRGQAQIFEDTAQADEGGGRFLPRCLDLGTSEDQVFLILYGTGIKGAPASALRVTVGGIETPVLFVGAQGTFVGLDQINLGPISRGLADAGTVDVVTRINDQQINIVQICIR
ncbi:MAG: IPT/TIG domain-containing protein [Acidobacteria bacterium]|nr:IPT/TIG domain-containing protein [Acidobacteriota bacterium]